MPYSTDPIIQSYSAFVKICLDKKQKPFFKYNPNEQDKFFYEMKQKYPKEFEMVSFDTNEPQPFSKTIGEARQILISCGKWNYLGVMCKKSLLSKTMGTDNFRKIKDKKTFLEIGQGFYDRFYVEF